MKLDPQSNILHLDTSGVPLKQISLQQGRLLLKFLWVFQTNVDLFLALYQNGFSKFMPLVLPQTYSPAFTYITGLKPDIFRKFTIPLAPEVMSTITHDNLLKHDPAILL